MHTEYYEILGIEPNATQNEIKKAYRKLAMKYHPDRHVNSDDATRQKAEAKFKEINKANDILSNEETRKRYDMFGPESAGESQPNFEDMFPGGFPFPGGMPGEFPFPGGFPFPGMNVNVNKLHTPNLTVKIKLSKSDIINGTSVEFNVDRQVLRHDGTFGLDTHVCKVCNGTGVNVRIMQKGNFIRQVREKCTNCDEGFVFDSNMYKIETQTFRKKIKPGTFVNQIFIKNKGHDIPRHILKEDANITRSMLVLELDVDESADELDFLDNGFGGNPYNTSVEIDVDLIDVLLGNTVEVRNHEGTIKVAIPKNVFFVRTYNINDTPGNCAIMVVPDKGIKYDETFYGDLCIILKLKQTEFDVSMLNDTSTDNIDNTDDGVVYDGINLSQYEDRMTLKRKRFDHIMHDIQRNMNSLMEDTYECYE